MSEHDDDLSPAQRYASYRKHKGHPVFRDFAAGFPFELDEFQVEGCKAVEDGDGVLVAAPTGAGAALVWITSLIRVPSTCGCGPARRRRRVAILRAPPRRVRDR